MNVHPSTLARNLTVGGLLLVLTAAVAGGSELLARSRRGHDLSMAQGGRSAQSQGGRSESRGDGQRGPYGGRQFEWWKDAEVSKELSLKPEEANRIDQIFQNRNRQMRPLAERLVTENGTLDKMTRERTATYEEYQLQVQNVENLFARLRESRRVMLYRMYQVLSQEQYQKLLQILERQRRTGRGRPTPER